MVKIFPFLCIIFIIFLQSNLIRNTKPLIDISDELEKADTYERLVSCLFLIEMKFDSNREALASKFASSPHRDKSQLYDKYYYTTLKYCMGKIKAVDSQFISKNFIKPNEIDKLNIVWIIDNEMNEKVLKDKNFKLELDEDEITIKNFIESDEQIERITKGSNKPKQTFEYPGESSCGSHKAEDKNEAKTEL